MFRRKQKNIFAVKRRNRGRNILIGIIIVLVLACVGVLVIYPMVRPINYTVEVEAGAGSVDPKEFAKHPEDSDVTVTWGEGGEPDWNVPGEYPVIVEMDGKVYNAAVEVVDTVVPMGEAQEVTWFRDKEGQPEPLEFVKDLRDATKVTAEFEVEPDMTVVGTQNVIVILTDQGGNQLRLEAPLTITDDQEAPVIYGKTNRLTYAGTVIPLDDGLAVIDDRDPNPMLTVDGSAVDFNVPGTYTVKYTASDSAGNVTEIDGTFTVAGARQGAIHIDVLNEAVDGFLAQIITDDMSNEEKLRAVYDWAKTTMLISKNPGDRNAWTKEAYRAVRWNAGDSFTTSSLIHACMVRMGYEDMIVQRTNGTHHWNLVNLGDGWFHVDASRASSAVETPVFLLTDAELRACSEQAGNGFYTFDSTLYPATK